jgi:predicted HTH domain antitoxin
MATNLLTIPYPESLLLSMKKSPEEFEAEARLLLAVKLYEMGQITTGTAASLAGISRVTFMFELERFGLSPLGQTPEELGQDLANA